MISIEDRKLFAKAEDKARQIKPRVKMEEFGRYSVASNSREFFSYTVRFEKVNGHWLASCTCPAHTGDKLGYGKMQPGYTPRPCFHIPAAYSVHAAEVYRRQQSRTSKCCKCGEEAVAGVGEGKGKWYCTAHLEAVYRAETRTQCANCKSYTTLSEAGLCATCESKVEGEAELDQVREMYTEEDAARDRELLFG